MNIEEVREYGMSLPGVTERMPFGPDTYSMEIGGKMFCLMTLAGEWDFYNLKALPEVSEELRERYHDILPGYHMNKRHWISVRFTGDVPDTVQKELIYNSYMLVIGKLPAKTKMELGLKTV